MDSQILTILPKKNGNEGGFNVCKCHLYKCPQGIVYLVITIKFPMNVCFNKQQIIHIQLEV